MSFANLTWPMVIAGLAGIASVLYLLQRLRVRHRPVVVPTTLFWNAVAQAAPARTLVERFRHPWAYALLLLICFLLWLAFAGPRPAADMDGTRHIAILDASATLTNRSRFDAVVDSLRRHVRTLPPARRQVLWSGAEVRTLLNPGEHDLLLARRLASLQPDAAPSRVDELLRSLALEARTERPIAITVFGDAPFEIPATADEAFRVARDVSGSDSAGANRGVVALGVADAASGAWTEVDVYLEIAGNERTAELPALEVDVDGAPVAAERLQAFATGEGRGWLISGLPAAGGLLRVRLEGGDAIPADDEAQLRLPNRPRIRVQLSPSLDVLRPALSADAAVELVPQGGQVVIRREGEEFGGDLPALLFVSRSDVAAFTFVHPERHDSRDVLRDAVDAIGLRDVDATALATAASRPVEVAVEPGPQWRIELWDELLSPEFNFTASRPFPLFLANAVRWLARTPGLTPSLAAGRPLVREAPDNAARALSSSGRPFDPLGDALIPARAGTFAFEDEPQPHRVSLLDRATTAAEAVSVEGVASAGAGSSLLAQAATWLLLVALLLLAVEWHLLQRGRIP